MAIDLTEVRALFFEESYENLDSMEASLLDVEVGVFNRDLINTIFRAAHSIKGGAGIFKYETIVAFAHTVETLLDEMRNEEHAITQALIDLLLRSVDMLRMLLTTLQNNEPPHQVALALCTRDLLHAVKTPLPTSAFLLADLPRDAVTPPSDVVDIPLETPVIAVAEDVEFKQDVVVDIDTAAAIPVTGWVIHFAPQADFFASGNDVTKLFAALQQLGALHIQADTHQVPALPDLAVDKCYLQWTLTLRTTADYAAVQEVFEWAEAYSDLQINPLNALPPEENQPEEGAATTNELEITAVVSPVSPAPESEQVTEKPIVSPPETSIPPSVSVPSPSHSPAMETAEDKNNRGHYNYAQENSIRVSIEKIDQLINIVGELVITQSMLEQLAEAEDETRRNFLPIRLAQLARHTRELQESVMRIRMLPIGFSFNRFPRLIHDLSSQLGKKVDLRLSGEQTELDKTVLEKMSDPLVHLVRNALDHGIELPAQRLAMGKPEVGTIHLHAFHQGSNIIIQISDDGAGIDLEKIREKARKMGLLTAEDNPTPEQLYDVLFYAGFSTAEQISNISGRGVGMDVVRRNIRALSGSIDVQSTLHVGTTFTIRLPLTLAILDGQLIRIGKEIYILPLMSIIESIRIERRLVSMVAGHLEVYRLRDEYIPILRLYRLFGITNSMTQLEQGLLVIIEAEGQKVGLFVDELLSQQQIVIKSLETNYKPTPSISGATILGDGNVALILDVSGLIQLTRHYIIQTNHFKMKNDLTV